MSEVEAKAKREAAADSPAAVWSPEPPTLDPRRRRLRILPLLITLAVIAVAVVLGRAMWDAYMAAPWTRDGTVRAYVVTMAPEVAGRIVEFPVADNQFVHKGDLLMVIDPTNYKIAVSLAEAAVQQAQVNLQNAEREAKRRQELTTLAVTVEEKQTYESTALADQAQYQQAVANLDQARVNLERTQIHSPVNGWVTNLLTQLGDYASVGTNVISLVDADSFWIDGYFEETKLARVCIGDRVEAKLMGYAQPILGHLATVTRGIGVSDAASGTQGLPNPNPVYTWVRLAQRVPVRIAIDSVPPGIPLVSGMSATVTIKDTGAADDRPWLDRAVAEIETRLVDVLDGPPARPGCIPPTTTERATPVSLPVDEQKSVATPEQINPGLAPGMSASPRNRS